MTLQELLGIQHPIIQAPMAGVQGSALAIAVSNAGGLGSLPCAMLDLDALRNELHTIDQQASKPINLNFFCHPLPPENKAEVEHWRRLFSGYYRELGIDPHTVPADPVRMPFDHHMAELVYAFKPSVVSFHFGLPSPDLLARVKASGAKVLSSATTVEEAIWLEAQGVDAVIAQGLEAGGHRGMFLTDDLNSQLGTFALLPQVLNAVQVPVIAAGGIADTRGVKAALAMGAAGVQIGTAYLLCKEATTSTVHRNALKSDNVRQTALTNIYTGRPARGIVNRLISELGPINSKAPGFPYASSVVTPLAARAEPLGKDDFSRLWCGQNTTGCKEVSAAELTLELAGFLQTQSLT